MKSAEKRWESLSSVEPSEQFACNYGGNFSQRLEINRPVIDRFLRIAALDGRILLKEGNSDRFRPAPDINPDGSTTGKGRLRWGEEARVDSQANANFWRVEQDSEGWVIVFNGGLMIEKLMEQKGSNVRKIEKDFCRAMDGSVKEGLKESLWRDKCSEAGDPFYTGRLVNSAAILFIYTQIAGDIVRGEVNWVLTLAYGLLLFGMAEANIIARDETKRDFTYAKKLGIIPILNKYVCSARRSTNNIPESLSLPLEIDRLLGGLGYLAWLSCRRNSVIRLSPDQN